MQPARLKAVHCHRRSTSRPDDGHSIFKHLMICTYKVQKKETTFRGNHKNIGYPSSIFLLCIQNILGTEVCKPLLEEIMKLYVIPVVMVTTNTEHIRS